MRRPGPGRTLVKTFGPRGTVHLLATAVAAIADALAGAELTATSWSPASGTCAGRARRAAFTVEPLDRLPRTRQRLVADEVDRIAAILDVRPEPTVGPVQAGAHA